MMNARGRMNKTGGRGISLPKRVGLEHFVFRCPRLGALVGNMLKSNILRLANHRRILILKFLTQPIPGIGVSGRKIFSYGVLCVHRRSAWGLIYFGLTIPIKDLVISLL